MADRLRVGVIGLGRRWQRYRRAATAPDTAVDVRAVFDPIPQRTTREARRLHCEAADGAEELTGRPDVDALLLCDRPWHGLWSLERAAHAGKPLCCLAPVADGDSVDALRTSVQKRSLPAMTALTAGFQPAAVRLKGLLDKHLGPARLVVCTGSVGRPVSGERLLTSAALLPGLDLCRQLLADSPETIWTAVPGGSAMVNLTLAFPDGRAACVTLTAGQRRPWRVAVSAEKGNAEALLPRRLRWRDASGDHALRLPAEPGPAMLLRRFADAVRAGQPASPSFDDACRVASWLRAACRSHVTGGPVLLAET
jgi:predicted dehydrogenase